MIRSDLKVTTCLEFDCVEDMVEAVYEEQCLNDEEYEDDEE